MPTNEPPRLSVFEKISLPFRLVLAAFRVVPAAASLWHLRETAGWHFKHVLAVALARSRALPPRLQNYLVPSAHKSIALLCAQAHLEHSSQTLDAGLHVPAPTLHRIRLKQTGDSDDNNRVLLYFHGGGYVRPMLKGGHPPFALKCAEAANATALFFLEYTLAPALKYPGQLAQAVAALSLLIDTLHLKPEQIILGGDSAGGNLILALLAHWRSPKPGLKDISHLLKTNEKNLLAIFLLSPMVTMRLTAPSARENAAHDMITPDFLDSLLAAWQPDPNDKWADFLAATTPAFWSDLPVTNILLTAGDMELIRDDVLAMSSYLKPDNPQTTTIIGKHEFHAKGVADTRLRLPLTGSSLRLLAWLSRLQRSPPLTAQRTRPSQT